MHTLYSLKFFLLFIFLFSCGEAPKPEQSHATVKAMQVEEKKDPFAENHFSGKAEAFQEANLGFEVAGTIEARPVHKGDAIQKGQVLAKLDPRIFVGELKAAQAELERAEAHRDRIKEALLYNAVAEQDLTDAEARVKEAEAAVSIKAKTLEDSIIYAPFEGMVSWTFKEKFQRVAAKETVLRVLDTSKIKFNISVPETVISYVPYVLDVDLKFDAFPDKTIKARVKEIGIEASSATRTYPVTLLFTQPKNFKILPGMAGITMGGRLKTPEKLIRKPVFEIPISSVFSDDETQDTFVWHIVDGKVKKYRIKKSETTSEGLLVEGLKKGMWIVTAGTEYLREGDPVKIEGGNPL